MPLRDPAILEQRLNAVDPTTRRDALAALTALREAQFPKPGVNVNMHCHSFFSYNALGWSPSRVAWEARKAGWYSAALCDFDVLDGLDEFLAAGRTLGLRTAVHLETRAFVREQATVDINSPGEPGVCYVMGGGFVSVPAQDTAPRTGLDGFRQAARARNKRLIARINAAVPAIALDYNRDVLPHTPLGVATERHIVAAYVDRAVAALPDAAARAAFWAPLLRLGGEAAARLEAEKRPAFEEAVRGALSKRGGLGYQQPDEHTFPPVDDFIAWVQACGALPLVTWLDGTSAGESDHRALLELMVAKGCAGLNIIPDRNWNLARTDEQTRKVACLDAIVQSAEDMDLPINIGTEMNRAGLPPVDDLSGPVLRRHRAAFVRGAQVMVGHSVMALVAGMPYLSAQAEAAFKTRKARNAFYAAIGALPPLTHEMADSLLDAGPETALARLSEAVANA